MKAILVLFLFTILISCDVYPQNVTIKTTYNTPTGIDSCYLLIWKGTNTALNPLVEDASYNSLGLPRADVSIYKVPIGTNRDYSALTLANGQQIKVAVVPFRTNLPAPLTVSAFYTLPAPPSKATIINVEIF